MNRKFAALLLFVGVTSAITHWCLRPLDSPMCPDEDWSGQATLDCCQQQDPNDFDPELGCDATVPNAQFDQEKFYECCRSRGCIGIDNWVRK